MHQPARAVEPAPADCSRPRPAVHPGHLTLTMHCMALPVHVDITGSSLLPEQHAGPCVKSGTLLLHQLPCMLLSVRCRSSLPDSMQAQSQLRSLVGSSGVGHGTGPWEAAGHGVVPQFSFWTPIPGPQLTRAGGPVGTCPTSAAPPERVPAAPGSDCMPAGLHATQPAVLHACSPAYGTVFTLQLHLLLQGMSACRSRWRSWLAWLWCCCWQQPPGGWARRLKPLPGLRWPAR